MTQQRFLNEDPRPDLPFVANTHRKADTCVLIACAIGGLILIGWIW